jgi:outer membrane assembly lipoprotein YfgL
VIARRLVRGGLLAAAAVFAAVVAGCASDAPKPTPLAPVESRIAGRLVWQAAVGSIDFPLVPAVQGGAFFAAGSDGTVVAIDAESGADRWRGSAGAPITAGVGSDGRFAAVVTRDNEVVVLEGGSVRWKARLASRTVTPPLVAGERVFVLAVDRSVHAFDALDGRRLWTVRRPGDPLTLLQPGVLAAFRETLLVAQGNRLAAVEPLRGNVLAEIPLVTPRGTNEVERLADLIGPATRVGDRVCLRAFQSAVGCIDVLRGTLLWSRNAAGTQAVADDGERLVGADATGRVSAWRAATGEPLWTNETLLHRGLASPRALGPVVVFGDFEGQVHFLAGDTGSVLLRLPTDGSAVVGTPALAGSTLLVATRRGGLFAFRPN